MKIECYLHESSGRSEIVRMPSVLLHHLVKNMEMRQRVEISQQIIIIEEFVIVTYEENVVEVQDVVFCIAILPQSRKFQGIPTIRETWKDIVRIVTNAHILPTNVAILTEIITLLPLQRLPIHQIMDL